MATVTQSDDWKYWFLDKLGTYFVWWRYLTQATVSFFIHVIILRYKIMWYCMYCFRFGHLTFRPVLGRLTCRPLGMPNSSLCQFLPEHISLLFRYILLLLWIRESMWLWPWPNHSSVEAFHNFFFQTKMMASFNVNVDDVESNVSFTRSKLRHWATKLRKKFPP